jgi:hypothetical protein
VLVSGKSPVDPVQPLTNAPCDSRPNQDDCLAKLATAAGFLATGSNSLLSAPSELELEGTTVIIEKPDLSVPEPAAEGPAPAGAAAALAIAAQAAATGQRLRSLGNWSSFFWRLVLVIPIAAIVVFLKGFGRLIALFLVLLTVVFGLFGDPIAWIADGAVAAAIVLLAREAVEMLMDTIYFVKLVRGSPMTEE